ncbi:Nn.00g059260.m01.CDS01 [Neocucurbitaria sp. VM-36]
MATLYPSQPIDDTSIRLFQLEHKTSNGCFEAKLKTVSFEELNRGVVDFNAASYTWGEGCNHPSITFKFGQPPCELPILERLVPFLNMIWEHEDLKKEWWWIDSICINQQEGKENTEKELQINVMAKRYSQAEQAVVWLGEEKDTEWKVQDGEEEPVEVESDCTGAISFMKILAKARAEARGRKRKMKFCREWTRREFDGEWAALLLLFRRNWWTRWWTLQEMLLPKHVTFFVGKESIARDAVNMAIYATWLCSKASGSIEKPHFEAAWTRRRLHQWWQRSKPQSKSNHENIQTVGLEEEAKGMSLLPILSYLGSHSTKDPKDRLYACPGLVNQRGLNVIPPRRLANEMSVRLLYANLVERFHKVHESLDIICFSHIFNDYNVSRIREKNDLLPSWVPDWRAQAQSSAVPLMASQGVNKDIGNCRPPRKNSGDAEYDAPGKLLRQKSNAEFPKNDDDAQEYRYLTEKGVILDSVNGLAGLDLIETNCKNRACGVTEAKHTIINSILTFVTIRKSALQLFEEVCRSLVLDRKDKYLRKRPTRHSTSQFLFMCYACIRNKGGVDPVFRTWFDPDPVFKAWYEQNRMLKFGDISLESAVSTIIESEDKSSFSDLPHEFIQTRLPNPLDSDFDEDVAHESFLKRFHDTVRKMSRRLMTTDKGYIGMAPCRARQGDVVAILFGCRIPLVLRRVSAQNAWRVIGEAYVDGWMSGEVEKLVDSGDVTIERIRLV